MGSSVIRRAVFGILAGWVSTSQVVHPARACQGLLETPQPGVVVLIRRGAGAQEEFLFVKRAPAKEDGGIWSLVAGKVESGEAQVDTVRRELQEELGVRVRPGRMIFSKVAKNGKYELFWWSAELEQGESPRIAAPQENTEFAWLTLVQLEQLEAQGLTYPHATQFLKELLEKGSSG